MTQFKFNLRAGALATIAMGGLTACAGSGGIAGGGGGGATVATPVNNLTGTGQLIAVALSGTTQNSASSGLSRTRSGSSAVRPTARTAPGGIQFDVTVDDDPASAAPEDVLLTSTAGQLADGTTVAGFTNEPTALQLQAGSFGDPQTRSAATASGTDHIAISGVSIYNLSATQTVDLDDVMTVRYWAGVNGTGTENIYGVGFYGNATPAAQVPANATYTTFLEPSTSDIYFDAGSTATITLAPTTFSVDVAGTLAGGANANVAGLAAMGTFSGNSVSAGTGTARFIDATGATVGTVDYSDLIGGLFGPNAREAAAAVIVEGNMDLNGNVAEDYYFSAVFGGTKN